MFFLLYLDKKFDFDFVPDPNLDPDLPEKSDLLSAGVCVESPGRSLALYGLLTPQRNANLQSAIMIATVRESRI